MGKINVLAISVANLIAAGEVVDRPASVIKELLENAIDSGANSITVEINNGGVTFMRVSDNGCGIEPEDLPVAVRRHATSKIKDAHDLEKIMTLGFRGEALAAIASVSNMRIISKQKNAEYGAMLEVSAGNIVSLSERGCSDGTTVIVEELFANVPARRKFLKKDLSEAIAVAAIVEKVALSRPDISFRFISDGNLKLESSGDGNLKNTIYSIFGKDFASKLIEVNGNIDGIAINGFVGRSDNVKSNRNSQNFFINGRYVKNKTMTAALEQAFCSYLPSEKFPCCVLFITLNPSVVDVNVHPSKLEVKFSNEKPIFELVYYSVRSALEQNTGRPSVNLERLPSQGSAGKVLSPFVPIDDGKRESMKKMQLSYDDIPIRSSASNDFTQKSELNLFADIQKQKQSLTEEKTSEEKDKECQSTLDLGDNYTAEQYIRDFINPLNEGKISCPIQLIDNLEDQSSEAELEALNSPESEPTFSWQIVGEVFNSYIIVQLEDKMLIVDKHAAHERIIFEELKAKMNSALHSSELLIVPIEVMLTSSEIEIIKQYRTEIEAIGFGFEEKAYSLNINMLPSGIASSDVADIFQTFADNILNSTGSATITRDIIFEKALYQVACKAAVKAGRAYPEGYNNWIVDKLMRIKDITVCPHGRPVAMEMSKKALDRQFERT